MKHPSEKSVFQIRVRGLLDPARSAWFGEMSISFEDGFTVMTGEVLDQSALFGVLAKVRDLGLELESVHRLDL